MRPASGKAVSVVIVDDNEVMRTLLRGILRAEETYEVIGEAGNGEAGLELIRRLRPQLVCLDVMMPVMNGIDVLREVSREFPEVAVVMVTGNASTENVQESIQNGARGFIVKPFNADRVLKTLAGIPRRPRSPDQ